MMIATRLMTALVVCLLPIPAVAQQKDNPAVVESVIAANPEPDGKAYLLSVQLKGGQQLSLQVPPAEAIKIIGGFSKIAGPESAQVVVLVQSVSMQADAQGRFVLLRPRMHSGPILPLAIPIEWVDGFLQLLAQKSAEARTNATKTQQHN
jgi:hypothetical protein